jgi:hypothetical protein
MSLYNGYTPPKTVEQTRRLVQSDAVALILLGRNRPQRCDRNILAGQDHQSLS